MGSLNVSDSTGSPALPEVPPISIRELAVGLADLFSKADGLDFPRYVTISTGLQEFGLQFGRSADSYRALAAWAQRFGAVLVSQDHTDEDGQPWRYVYVTFEYSGIGVKVYAFIPVTETGS